MNDLSNWQSCPNPENVTLKGDHVTVETWDRAKHQSELWAALDIEDANKLMHYFPQATFDGEEDFGAWLEKSNSSGAFQTMVFRSHEAGKLAGMASYMAIDAKNGSIEVGAVAHGPQMSRSRMSTEAHYLMAKYVFEDLGYRRYEWKLNNENKPSHRAALRFGFAYEGLFRQHIVAKGRNRDTAWYSMIDGEWPLCKAAFEAWLSDQNFDAAGLQVKTLEEIRDAL
ncbi:GNAT family N-acetyltransferase [Lentilitoribacter sp. EG35]|uniref:GNAT family N-acetyltransferase n=1 Tax=Lentilitoribacter sp. EG35 TaxID=3234192 RepID=UPI00345F36E7